MGAVGPAWPCGVAHRGLLAHGPFESAGFGPRGGVMHVSHCRAARTAAGMHSYGLPIA